jgi:hypothetical protein
MSTIYDAPPEIGRLRQQALIVGAVFLLALVVGAFITRAGDQFFHSYLIGYLFWTGIALGSLALLMLQHLTGGGWGMVIRRPLEAATRTLPLMLLLFMPILFGGRHIYPWIEPSKLLAGLSHDAARALTDKMDHYLNRPFFIARAAVYFAIWLLLAFLLNKWSREQDTSTDRRLTKNLRVISGPGMVLFIITVSFAAIDWVMSITPAWSSTIFGLLFVASFALSALAFVIAIVANLSDREPMANVVAPLHFHDLGKLLLALVMLWAYFDYSQFLIIWSGNLPEEIVWYLPRMHGGWGALALVVVVLHFAFPFFFLLSRSLKRNPHRLVSVAVLILIMRVFDLIWVIGPAFSGATFHISWMDFAAPLGIGGIWLAMFANELNKRPLMAFNDPQMESVLEQAHEDHGEQFIKES